MERAERGRSAPGVDDLNRFVNCRHIAQLFVQAAQVTVDAQIDDWRLGLHRFEQLGGLLGTAQVLTQHLCQIERQRQPLTRGQRRIGGLSRRRRTCSSSFHSPRVR